MKTAMRGNKFFKIRRVLIVSLGIIFNPIWSFYESALKKRLDHNLSQFATTFAKDIVGDTASYKDYLVNQHEKKLDQEYSKKINSLTQPDYERLRQQAINRMEESLTSKLAYLKDPDIDAISFMKKIKSEVTIPGIKQSLEAQYKEEKIKKVADFAKGLNQETVNKLFNEYTHDMEVKYSIMLQQKILIELMCLTHVVTKFFDYLAKNPMILTDSHMQKKCEQQFNAFLSGEPYCVAIERKCTAACERLTVYMPSTDVGKRLFCTHIYYAIYKKQLERLKPMSYVVKNKYYNYQHSLKNALREAYIVNTINELTTYLLNKELEVKHAVRSLMPQAVEELPLFPSAQQEGSPKLTVLEQWEHYMSKLSRLVHYNIDDDIFKKYEWSWQFVKRWLSQLMPERLRRLYANA